MYRILDYTGDLLYEGDVDFSTIAGLIVGLFTLFKGSLILEYQGKQYGINQSNYNSLLKKYIKAFGYPKEDILQYNYEETGYYIWVKWTDYKYTLYFSEDKAFIDGFLSSLINQDFRDYIYGGIIFYQNGTINNLTIEDKHALVPVISQEYYDIPYMSHTYQDTTDYF